MQRLWLVLVPFVGLLLPVLSAAQDAPKLNGTWLPIEAELNSQKLPEEALKTMTLTLSDGKYTVKVGDKLDEGTYKVDAKAKPIAIDITGVEGPNKGKTILSILELNGDTLKVCYDLTGKNRPTEFKTEKGKALFLITYQRETK